MIISEVNPFSALSIPKCLPHATLVTGKEEVVLAAGGAEYAFSADAALTVHAVFPLINGMYSVETIAQKSGVPIDDIFVLLRFLSDERLLIDLNAGTQDMSGRTAVELVKREAAFWRRHIDSQPFWKILHEGQCSERQILGWGIEFYHYVDAANEYMALGVAYCRESIDIRQKLAAQYAEEAGHGKIFLEGLVADGLPSAGVEKALPLASTRALINYLNEVATEGTLVYSAIFALMQSDGEAFNKAGLTEYYGSLISLYPFASGMFGAFLKHASIDAQLGHQQSLFEVLYENDTLLAAHEVARVLATLRQLVNYYILFYEYIFEYYGDEASQLPRRAPRVADFLTLATQE